MVIQISYGSVIGHSGFLDSVDTSELKDASFLLLSSVWKSFSTAHGGDMTFLTETRMPKKLRSNILFIKNIKKNVFPYFKYDCSKHVQIKIIQITWCEICLFDTSKIK